MHTLKVILLVVLVIIAIPLVIALFVKKEYLVERNVTINKPKQEVFNYLKFLKNQDNFNKWVKTDPNMKKDFRGTDGTVGFVYAWDGNSKAGKGEQEIKQLQDGEKVDVEIRFEKPFASIASTPFTTTSVSPTQTKVTWAMKGKSKYPINFMNLFMDKLLGSDIDSSLLMLKGVLEKPVTVSGNINGK
ncbi:MAG: SRPBCC family protein [Ferruginibacter sp.]